MMDDLNTPETVAEYLAAKKLKDAAQKANKERSEANSRRKLESVIQKKCQTTMIGALARFEERFGQLWNHGKPEKDLTEEERSWREMWDLVRTEVLNNGNNQIRAIKEELGQYNVNYEGYQLKLPVKSVTITADPN
jgi:high-affinity Fe2+/Pb2+ permease